MRVTSDRTWPFRLQPLFSRSFGIVLVLSAGLKVAGSGDASLVSSKQLPSGMSLLLVGAELLAGVWLLSGFAARAGRVVAELLLLAFLGVNLVGAFRGLPSCGCFGEVRVRPEYVAAAEALYVAALLGLPVRAAWTAADGHALWTLGLAAVLVGSYLGAGWLATGQVAPDWYAAEEGVLFRHDLPPHDPQANTTLELTWINDDSEPVQWTHLVSSCGCMQAPTLPVWVAPHATARVPLLFTTPTKPGEYRRNFVIETSRATLRGSVSGRVREPVDAQSVVR